MRANTLTMKDETLQLYSAVLGYKAFFKGRLTDLFSSSQVSQEYKNFCIGSYGVPYLS